MAEQPEASPTAGVQPQGSKDSRKQMVITDDLREHIGNILAVDLELDEPQFPKVLAPPRSRGRPEDMEKLANFLMQSVHKDAVGRKTTEPTVSQWINALREIGIKENQRILADQEPGRSSVPENQHPYVRIWADLMQAYATKNEEAVKVTRYNRVPDHLVGKVELLKCNSAFLPDPRSVGQGAGKNDQAAAIANVMKRKQDAIEKQAEAGDDSGKTREHLEPKKRVGDGGFGSSNRFEDALVSMMQNQGEMAHVNARRLAMEEKQQMTERLDKYMQYVMNPHIPEELKANYYSMIHGLQKQLHAADMAAPSSVSQLSAPSSASSSSPTTPAYTPTRPQPPPRQRSTSSTLSEDGLLGRLPSSTIAELDDRARE